MARLWAKFFHIDHYPRCIPTKEGMLRTDEVARLILSDSIKEQKEGLRLYKIIDDYLIIQEKMRGEDRFLDKVRFKLQDVWYALLYIFLGIKR